MVQRSKKEKVKIALCVHHLDSKNWYSVRLWNRPRKNLKRIGFREKKKVDLARAKLQINESPSKMSGWVSYYSYGYKAVQKQMVVHANSSSLR